SQRSQMQIDCRPAGGEKGERKAKTAASPRGKKGDTQHLCSSFRLISQRSRMQVDCRPAGGKKGESKAKTAAPPPGKNGQG
ncbi:hypothetical protein ACFL6C_12005, partial [Myxococcota bacterium]